MKNKATHMITWFIGSCIISKDINFAAVFTENRLGTRRLLDQSQTIRRYFLFHF